MTEKHWAESPEAGNFLGIHFLFWTERVLGRRFFRLFLFFTLFWFVLRRKTARLSSFEYWQRLYEFSEQVTPHPSLILVFRHFFAFSENLLDKLLSVSGKFDAIPYLLIGKEHIENVLMEKRGYILITAHYGNIEILQRIFQHSGKAKISVISNTSNALIFDRMRRKLNPNHNINFIAADTLTIETAIMLSERVSRGEVIVMAADRIPISDTAHTVSVPFLGAPALFPTSPYLLASALGCPLFAAFGRRENKQFLVSVTKIADKITLPKRKDPSRQNMLASYAQIFSTLLEKQCLQAPLQWANFFPFWDVH